MRELRLARERAPRALELTLPAVRGGQRLRALELGDRQHGECPQPLSLGRSFLQLPGELRERAPPRPAPHVVGIEERRDLVPEGARLARASLVGGRFADERQPARRPGAGGVEEVALALDCVGPDEPRVCVPVERAAGIVVEERGGIAAAGQRPFLETEQEDSVETARAGTRQVEDGDPAPLGPRPEPHLCVLERRQHLIGRELAAERTPAVELVEEPCDRVVGTQVGATRLADRRCLEAVGAAQHRGRDGADSLDRPQRAAECLRAAAAAARREA